MPEAKSSKSPKNRNRVAWSAPERKAIIERAITLHAENPSLFGLPLIREAMKVLPVNRKRRVITRTQVPWFEVEFADELRRRSTPSQATEAMLIDHAKDPYVPILRKTSEATQQYVDISMRFVQYDEEWRSNATAFYESLANSTKQILATLKLIEAKLSDCETSPKSNV